VDDTFPLNSTENWENLIVPDEHPSGCCNVDIGTLKKSFFDTDGTEL
jgi:hypothetical protein